MSNVLRALVVVVVVSVVVVVVVVFVVCRCGRAVTSRYPQTFPRNGI